MEFKIMTRFIKNDIRMNMPFYIKANGFQSAISKAKLYVDEYHADNRVENKRYIKLEMISIERVLDE